MNTFKITPTTTTISTPSPYRPPVDSYRVNVGGRRRKSRRGKSRKYKRTLKRRKNKTKNRKSTKNKETKRHMGGKWSRKYKLSIDCSNPKGFSQKQHCKYGRK